MSYQEKRVIVSLKEMNTTRQSLMAVYRLFEQCGQREPGGQELEERRQELDVYMKSIQTVLIGMQEYEHNIMAWSEISCTMAEQTGYDKDEIIGGAGQRRGLWEGAKE